MARQWTNHPSHHQPSSSISEKYYRIAVASAHVMDSRNPSRNEPKILQTFDNHRKYAMRHQYTYVCETSVILDENNQTVSKYWTKVVMLQRLLSPPYSFDWVLWVDSDAVVLPHGMSQSIEHFLNDPINRIVLYPIKAGLSPSSSTSSTAVPPAATNAIAPPPNNTDATASNHSSPHTARSIDQPVTSFIFSGDENAINDGVMLTRRTDFSLYMLDQVRKIGAKLDAAGVSIGMKYDNAAFSIFLGGCNSSSACNVTDYQRCYDRVDLGYNLSNRFNPARRQIESADLQIYARMLHPSVLPHVMPVRQSHFQSHAIKNAKFILHFPNRRDKFKVLLKELKWNADHLDQLVP